MRGPKIVGVDWEEVRVTLRTVDGRVVVRPEPLPYGIDYWVKPPITEVATPEQRQIAERCFRRTSVKWVPKLEPEPGTPFYGVSWGPFVVSCSKRMEGYLETLVAGPAPDHVVEGS